MFSLCFGTLENALYIYESSVNVMHLSYVDNTLLKLATGLLASVRKKY
jgi:hypothetical protein